MGFITTSLQLSGDTYTSPVITKILTGDTIFNDDTSLVTSATIQQYVTNEIIVSGGSYTALSGLTDTIITNPQDNDVLSYLSGEWINTSGGTGGEGYWTKTGSDIYYDTGNVGIGTDTPLVTLQIEAVDNPTLRLQDTGHQYMDLHTDTSYGYIDYSNILHIRAGTATKVTILANGNVGFGEFNPDTKIHIKSDNNTGITQEYTGGWNNVMRFQNTTGSRWIGNTELNKFIIGATEDIANQGQFTILANGDVGINDTSPTYKLDVNGTGRFTSNLTIGSYTLPIADGSSNQVLQTNGSGTVTWATGGGSGTVTSVIAGNGMTQTGTSTINPTLNVVSHAGTSGSIGTINIGANAIGVNLGTTSTTAYRGDYGNTAYTHSQDNTQAHSDYLINNGNDSTTGALTANNFIGNGSTIDLFTGTATGGNTTAYLQHSGSGRALILNTTGTNTEIAQFRDDSTAKFTFYVTGNSTQTGHAITRDYVEVLDTGGAEGFKIQWNDTEKSIDFIIN